MKNKNINIVKKVKNIFSVMSKIFIVCLFIAAAVFSWFFSDIKSTALPAKVLAASCTAPVDVIMVLDSSGSMADNNKMATTKVAAKDFIDKLNLTVALPSGDQVGLVSFNDAAILNNKLTQNGNIVKNSIDNLSAGGQTNLKIGIETGTIELNNIRHNASARKTMIILTDGNPNRPYPEDTAGQQAIDAAAEAKNTYGIRIITIGLELQNLPEAERIALIAVLTNVASAPADFFQATDPISLGLIYDTISAALCDSTAPQIISYNRNPSGTVYSADTIKITSTASDNIGIKSHLIKWTADNWATEDSSSSADCDVNRNNCSIIIGPFASNANIKYKIAAVDTNDNVANSAIESFNITSLSITASNFLRNTNNNVAVDVNDPDGNLIAGGAKFYLTAESPEGSGVNKIDKAEMICVGDNINKSCSYPINPACSWTDSGTKIYIFPYDNKYDLKYHNPPATKSVTISNPVEAKTEPGRCNNCINDDCDAGNKWDLANYNNTSAGCGSIAAYDANFAEPACDNLAPILAISRAPAGNVYETSNLTLTSLATEIPSGLNALQSHKIWYRINGGAWTKAFECLDVSPVDGLCDADTSKSISTFSIDLGAHASGTKIDYYSEATDTAPGTPNTGRSSPTFDTVTVAYAECYDIDGTQKTALAPCTGGKCCGGVCNSAASYNTNCTLDDQCRQEICSGANWTCAPANIGFGCSVLGSSGSDDGCFSYLTGCEERNYSCQTDGSCNYPAPSNRNIDGCASPPNSKLFGDFSCSGSSCVAASPVDCSVPVTPGVCSCSCGGYGKEEKFYGALSVDGADDYVNVPNNVYSDNMTLEMWVKPRAINTGSYQGFGGYQGASSFYRPFNLWVGPNNGVLHWWISKSNNSATHGGSISNFFTGANLWYHIVFVKDGVKLKIYKNGVPNALPDAPFADIYKPGAFWLGKIDNYFNGIIDEVRVYSRALDEAEVIQHYQGTYLNETNLAGLWHLDGNANDSFGAKNGTLNLGSAGNINPAAAWVSDKTDVNNISPVWRVCSDVDVLNVAIDNDCDSRSNSVLGLAEAGCDNKPPEISFTVNPTTIYDDIASFTLNSSATDEFGISQHKIKWTSNNWATFSEQNCPASGICSITAIGVFPAGTWIQYRAEAVDNNGNFNFKDAGFTVLSRSCEAYAEGSSCGAGDTCISTDSLGCERMQYVCKSGVCSVPFAEVKDDRCGDWMAPSKILKDFSCDVSGACVFIEPDCSTSGAVNGCACSCDGFGKEEKFYKSLSLDGIDDRLDIPNSAALNMGTGDFAVEFWTKSTKNATMQAIGKNSAWFGLGKGWHFSTASSPADFLFEVSNGATREFIPSGLGRVFGWTHIVGQRKTNKLELYVNGVKVVTPDKSVIGDISNALPLRIGSYAGTSNYFGGALSGVHVYNRFLTETEIKQHFAGSYPNEVAMLKGLWSLDGSANDVSGNGNNGILSLGSSGNTTIANAWIGNKSSSNNVPPPLQTICTDGKDNNCNSFTDSIPGFPEAGCDNVFDSITVGQSPAGIVYGSDAITLNSVANDNLAITSHNIQWNINDGPWNYTLLSDCSKSADEKTSTCAKNIGIFAAGTKIKYKAEAMDANENIGVTTEREIIIRDACYGQADGGSCAANTGVCCGGFCDSTHWRKGVTISGSTGGIATDYQIKVTVTKEAKMKSDFSDVYFTDTDGVAMLSFWRESYDATSAVFWVKVPSIPIAPGTKVIYMYYGSPIVNTASNGTAAFGFFDDFTGSSVDTSKWTIVNATGFSVANGELKGADTTGRIRSIPVFSNGNILEIKSRYVSLPANGYQIGGFYLAANNGFGSLDHPGFNYYRNDSNWVAIGAALPATTDLLTKISVKSASAVDLSIINYTTGASYKNYPGLVNTVSAEPIVLGQRYDNLNAGQSYEAYWDWVRIRKYISPEPTVAIGAEASTSLTDYLLDSECSQTACSAAIPTVWTWTASNNGNSCSDGLNSNGCYVWPALGNGCETRTYACNGGSCVAASSGQSIDSCSGNTFNDYGCGNSCSGAATSYNCSQTGGVAAAYDNPALACNCRCGGYDTEEKFYGSLNLDGADDYVELTNSSSLNSLANLTLAAWVYPTELDVAKRYFIFNSWDWASNKRSYLLGIDDNKLAGWLSADGTASSNALSSSLLSVNTWHYVAMTYDGNIGRLYINGEEKGTISLTGNLYNPTSMKVLLGQYNNTEYFKGMIDEARIYNRVLPQNELLQQFNGEYTDNSGIVGLWHLDGNTSDFSGNGNNGTLKLGTLGNIVNDIAWKSTRVNANNVPSPWRMCTDTKNNDCDALGKIDAAELACDGQAPLVTLEAKDNSGNVIVNGAILYDINIDEASEKLSFTSLATDNFSLLSYKFRWTTNNWVVTNELDCLGGVCNPYELLGINFSALPKPIMVKYYVIATDNNGNTIYNPPGGQAAANNFSIIAFNNPPVVSPVSITQTGDYCKGGPQLTVKWNYSDPDLQAQKAYQVEIADNPSFIAPYTSPVFSSSVPSGTSASATFSSGWAYNSTYYWRVKVWDNSSLSMVSAGSGGVCGEWKCDLGQFATTSLHAYPTVNFDWLPESPKASEEVQFNNISTPNTGVTWEWDLNSPSNKCGSPSYKVTSGQGGNSDNATDWNPTYIYSDPTIFTIGLKVTDSDGYACEIQKCISIGKKPPRWKEIIPK